MLSALRLLRVSRFSRIFPSREYCTSHANVPLNRHWYQWVIDTRIYYSLGIIATIFGAAYVVHETTSKSDLEKLQLKLEKDMEKLHQNSRKTWKGGFIGWKII